jgi:predicted nucleic acid-binding protein
VPGRGFDAVRFPIDYLIATFCLNGGHTLLFCDSDFNPFEEHLGLQVIHPSSAA